MNSNETKPVLIIGAGGHSKVILEILRLLDLKIIGFVDPEYKEGDRWGEIDCLGEDEVILEYKTDDIILANGIGSLPFSYKRWEIAEYYESLGFCFLTIIHPEAIISSKSTISEGAQIFSGAIIQSGASIGRHSIINTGAQIDHDTHISECVHVAPGSVICGEVTINKRAHIGPASVIINGIEIGSKAVIGAGSVITKNIEESIKYIEKRETYIEQIGENDG